MTDEQLTMIRTLRDQGYAIVIFTPDELGNAPSEAVEDAMVSNGWDTIATLKDEVA
jgi:hypothetical protein